LQAFHGGSFRLGAKPNSLGKLWYLTGSLISSDPHPTPPAGYPSIQRSAL
jgi:hypothetical protein